MTRLNALLWYRVPLLVDRGSRTLGTALRDGAYLTRLSVAALVAPLAAFLYGYFWATTRDTLVVDTYTFSLTFLGVALAIGCFGAALGLWTTLGYAIADFFFVTHDALLKGQEWSLEIRASFLLSYLLLGLLLVSVPLAATLAKWTAVGVFSGHAQLQRIAGIGVQAAVAGVGAWGWTKMAPLLITPVYTWNNDLTAPIEAIQPLQTHPWNLAMVAALASAARAGLELYLLRAELGELTRVIAGAAGGTRTLPAQGGAAPTTPAGPAPAVATSGGVATITAPPPDPRAARSTAGDALRSVGGAALLTFLLSGLYTGWGMALVTFAIFAASAVARTALLPSVDGYMTVVTKVPAIIRVALCAGIAFLVGRQLVQNAYASTSDDSFGSLVWSMCIAVALAGVLLPIPRRSQRSVAAGGDSP